MQTDELAATHLGKQSKISDSYDNSLLVAVPRYENRKIYDICDALIFDGFDVWHCYEFSALCKNGFPVTKVLKIKYDCASEFLVESKSLKLYLTSFNMTRFANTEKETLDICKNIIQRDLSQKLQTEVLVNFIEDKVQKCDILKEYKDISEMADVEGLEITFYKEAPELLELEKACKIEYRLKFTSLRSNCRITHQPDFGDVFIYYKSDRHILEKSLIEYLVSFRNEYHFHEECCEMIYKRLYDILDKDDELAVCILYTRRGGIDINPVRMSKNCNIKDFDELMSLNKFARCTLKQ